MTRIPVLLATIFFVSPDPSRADINSEFQIACGSGAVDTESNMLVDLTDEACQQACLAEKCDEVTTTDAADACLGSDSLLGCLFDVNQMRPSQPEWCATTHKENGENALSIVAKVSKEDLTDLKGSIVKDVFLRLGIENTNALCAHKEVQVAHSLVPFDSKTCAYSGRPEIEGFFSLKDNVMIIGVTSMLKGLYGTNQDVTIWAELKDSACNVTVKSAEVVFSVEYQTGYSPSVGCLAVKSCRGCLANGCPWCDWSKTLNFFLPNWLPDWDLIDAARQRNKNNGVCGVNSGFCMMSLGRPNQCGALSALSAAGAIAAIAVAASMVTTGEN